MRGVYTAVITPFDATGKIDLEAFRRILQDQKAAGITGVIPCGTTGESPTLERDEKKLLIRTCLEELKGSGVRVIAGTGSNCTDEAISLTRFAKKAGADGALLAAPYYNKPTQEGLFRHYEAVAKAVDIPVILYNIPGRSVVNIAPETVARLAKIPTIVGIKEASGSMDQTSHILSLCDITVLSGDDSLTLPLLSLGAKGVISVASNVVPEGVSAMVDAYFAGNYEKAKELHYKLFSLCRALFVETNPIPVKKAMQLLGFCGGDLRLPLCPMQAENEKRLIKALKDYGLSVKE